MDLEGSERRQLMESCEGQQKALEQLCVDALSTSDLDPSALLAEARRRPSVARGLQLCSSRAVAKA